MNESGPEERTKDMEFVTPRGMRQRRISTPESRENAQNFSGIKKGILTFSLTVDNETIKLDKDDYWVA